MLKCGLLGRKLGHSYSPAIHGMLSDYSYELFEREPEQLEDFLLHGDWNGINVTIPYKKTVLPYCRELSPLAKEIGSVNTIVRRPDGSLFGDNTDAYGFESLVKKSGIDVRGKKALVLGSGGASVTVVAVLKRLGAGSVTVISRSGEDNYDNIQKHADAKIIVNTTPVGMFPNNGQSAVDLGTFPACEGVLDVVYNPARTAMLLQAEQRGIPHAGGLYMLVAQAKRSSEIFTGSSIPDSEIERIEKVLSAQMQNIILIGMPSSGKSTIAAALGEKLGRPVYEADALIEEEAGMDIPAIFAAHGEEYFRKLETQVLRKLGAMSGAIISTGGGSVTREENYAPLHQNGRMIWLLRDTDKLDKTGRPVSLRSDLNELYTQRQPMYARFADAKADNNGTVEETLEQIMEALK
mgnify:FL=1